MFAHLGPCYLRIASRGEPSVHASVPAFSIGHGIRLREGSEVALITAGNMLETTVTAAGRLLAAKAYRSA